MAAPSFITIPGFLGSADEFSIIDLPKDAFYLDLYGVHALSPGETKAKWIIRTLDLISSIPSPRIAIGYSLGARLALELAYRDPTIFSKLNLISVNPGLTSQGDRAKRLEGDQHWAKRFLSEPYKKVLEDWNAQPVFAKSTPRSNYPSCSPQVLAETMLTFSLAHQPDFRDFIRSHAKQITLIVGEHDQKFVSIAEELKQSAPELGLQIIKGAGHRVLADVETGALNANQLCDL